MESHNLDSALRELKDRVDRLGIASKAEDEAWRARCSAEDSLEQWRAKLNKHFGKRHIRLSVAVQSVANRVREPQAPVQFQWNPNITRLYQAGETLEIVEITRAPRVARAGGYALVVSSPRYPDEVNILPIIKQLLEGIELVSDEDLQASA